MYEKTCNLKDVSRKITMIKSNCRKIILFEKSDCICGLDQIVGKFLQFEQFGFNLIVRKFLRFESCGLN